MRLYLLLFVCLFTATTLIAQNSMSNWRVHFSINNTVGMAKNSNSVFMATINGIVKYDTEDNSVSFLTVTNGLSDLNISAIADNGDLIIIGYLNGNIDILKDNIIINVPWIKRTQITGSKAINSFYFHENRIYISTNIGIVIYDINKNEIEDTYYPYLNPEINAVTIFKDSIYAATNNGIYAAHTDQNYLNDINQWYKKLDLPLYITSGVISSIEEFQNNLFFVLDSEIFQEDSLYYISNTNQLINYYQTEPTSLITLKAEENELLIVKNSSLEIMSSDLTLKTLIYDYNFGTSPKLISALKFGDEYWIADSNNGMIKALSTWNNSQIFSNSPYTDGCYRLDVQYGKLLVAGGGLTHNLHNNYFKSLNI